MKDDPCFSEVQSLSPQLLPDNFKACDSILFAMSRAQRVSGGKKLDLQVATSAQQFSYEISLVKPVHPFQKFVTKQKGGHGQKRLQKPHPDENAE